MNTVLRDSETVSAAIVKRAIQRGISRLSVRQKDPILAILSKLSSHHLIDLQPSLRLLPSIDSPRTRKPCQLLKVCQILL